MTEDRNRGEDGLRWGAQVGTQRAIGWLVGGGLAVIAPFGLILIAVIAGVTLLAGAGYWLSSFFGPHPPAIATDASRPAEWLTPITQQSLELGIPNSLVMAVINQASDGQVYGDR